MNSTDETAFTALIAKTWRFYGKTPTGANVADWFELLESFPLEAIAAAFKRHLTDPKAGAYLPKPADVIRHLSGAQADDGPPGADEAWGLLVRLIRDERETGVLTDEMRAGWQACQPILDLGDEVGARRCFIEVYQRRVQDARQNGVQAHWTATLGTDPALRVQRLQEAVQARRISADHARALLPGPTPASLGQVAGLLEGPDATPTEARTAERLRALAALLRANSAEAARRRAEERQRQREADQERRAAIQGLIDADDRREKRDAA